MGWRVTQESRTAHNQEANAAEEHALSIGTSTQDRHRRGPRYTATARSDLGRTASCGHSWMLKHDICDVHSRAALDTRLGGHAENIQQG